MICNINLSSWKIGKFAIINYIKPQLKSHPSCCKDSRSDKGVRYIANLLTVDILNIRLCYQQHPNSRFKLDASKEQPPTEVEAATRGLISHFHRLWFNTFLQGESALKEVQPFSISTLIPHGGAKMGCSSCTTSVGQTIYSLRLGSSLKHKFQTVQTEHLMF